MRALTAAVLLPLALGAAAAAQTTDPAGPGCRMKIDPVEFGTYHVLAGDPDLAVGRIEIICRGGGPGLSRSTRVSFSSGFSGHASNRHMANGDAKLFYNLYADPARTRIVGEGPGQGLGLTPAFVVSDRAAAPFSSDRVVYRVYGEIPPRQLVPSGSYVDVIEIIVEF